MRSDPFGEGLNLYAYCFNNPNGLIDPMGLCALKNARWGQAANATLGLVGNALGVVVGSALVAAPEPTMVTKAVGGIVLGKSVIGWGLNWYNLIQAFNQSTDRYDAPSSATRGIAAVVAPGNEDALLAADAVDLTIDLLAGRGAVYAYGKPTIQGVKGVTRPYKPVDVTFTHPGPVKSFQTFQTVQTVRQDLSIVNNRVQKLTD